MRFFYSFEEKSNLRREILTPRKHLSGVIFFFLSLFMTYLIFHKHRTLRTITISFCYFYEWNGIAFWHLRHADCTPLIACTRNGSIAFQKRKEFKQTLNFIFNHPFFAHEEEEHDFFLNHFSFNPNIFFHSLRLYLSNRKILISFFFCS